VRRLVHLSAVSALSAFSTFTLLPILLRAVVFILRGFGAVPFFN
jgi:hypothetical protein